MRKDEQVVIRVTKEVKEQYRRALYKYLSENPGYHAGDFLAHMLKLYEDVSSDEIIRQCIESRRRVLIR
mgnify:CR=1 FL=1